MAYIGSSPTKVVSRQSANIFTYTATANQTAFTGADANGNTLACSPSDIMVHMNGIKLEESDYTASTTTVTLGSGAAAGDEVTITAFLTFESADHYTKSAADTRYVNTTGDTMSGNLGIGGSPKPYLSAYKALDMNTGRSSIMSSTGTPQTWMMTNSYYDSTNSRNEYSVSSHAASYYLQQTGEHSFATAPSGTADAAITFTERMKIDNSGRVTMPYQPQFIFQGSYNGWTVINQSGQWLPLTGSTGVATSTNNELAMNWTSSRSGGYNPSGNGINANTGVYTAPVNGTYMFTFQTYILKVAAGSGYIHINSFINGSNQDDYTIYGYNENAGVYLTPELKKVIRMSANDTFGFRLYTNVSDYKIYPHYTCLTGYLLG